jgi:pimeloyl-ACP methyl ester carboxylesterase
MGRLTAGCTKTWRIPMTALSLRAIPAARRASALYCAVHGSGTPLLLIHGLGASGAVFQPLLPALAARYKLIIPDLRGHGHSRCLPGPDSLDRMADDIVTLLDMLRVPACLVLGHATGAAVAQQLARACPERVRGLALVCGYARNAWTLREQIESRLRPELFRLIGARGVSTLAGWRSTSEDESEFVHQIVAANNGQRVAEVARALHTFDSRPWLRELACPTLVVAGEADATTPPRHAHELAHGLPAAQLHVLPRAGHWLLKTHTAALLDIVLPWLAEREGAA